MTPYVDDTDFTLYVGDVREVLRTLPDESVHMVCTSPPYWGLRSYIADGHEDKPLEIGLEPTPDEYVANMVSVFREVRRVLRRDGVCFLNLGDSYCSQPNQRVQKPGGRNDTAGWEQNTNTGSLTQGSSYVPGLKPKDLVGLPWRVAFALQADGWYLRSDIIWSKPNPMPESVTDRPTKAHEYVFLLTRSPRYFFDQEAVREKSLRAGDLPGGNNGRGVGEFGVAPHAPFNGPVTANRNVRSVWEIATQPYAEAHFATFPEALVERCVKAGTSEKGCCPECGAPWERQTQTARPIEQTERQKHLVRAQAQTPRTPGGTGSTTFGTSGPVVTTTGWLRTCVSCFDLDPVPCVVLDPFMGSGTTALVARRLGRRSIGVELNAQYANLAAKRLQQLSLLA